MNRSLALLPALSLLVAIGCEPVDEGPVPLPDEPRPVELRSGPWQFEILSAELMGACDGISRRDLVGQVLEGELEVRVPGPASLFLDGAALRGHFDGRLLELAGDPVAEPEPRPEPGEEERPEEPDGGGDEERPAPPCEAEPEPDGGAVEPSRPPVEGAIVLIAQAIDARRLEGSLSVDLRPQGLDCQVEVELEGRQVERRPDDPVEPEPVPGDEEEKPVEG